MCSWPCRRRTGPRCGRCARCCPTNVHPDTFATRVVRFHRRYFDAVSEGTKTSTVRWDDPIPLGPALFVFEDHPDNPVVTGEVLTTTRYRLDKLTPAQANLPPDTDMNKYRHGLRGHYPRLPDDAEVDVVTFAVAGMATAFVGPRVPA